MARTALAVDVVRSLLHTRGIATRDELKMQLGTSSTMTVFRKLKALGYLTSYSHRGKYYTLEEIPDFDDLGLWSCRSVWFSRYGTLLETSWQLVNDSQSGLTAAELHSLVHVEVKQPLLRLYRQGRLERKEFNGVYVYFARMKEAKRKQRLIRQDRQAALQIGHSPLRETLSSELNAAIILLFSLLDEKQRRLYAGLESQKLGYGGDRKVADALGLDVHTVARGRRELFAGELEQGRVRKSGGGRKRVEKKRPR